MKSYLETPYETMMVLRWGALWGRQKCTESDPEVHPKGTQKWIQSVHILQKCTLTCGLGAARRVPNVAQK